LLAEASGSAAVVMEIPEFGFDVDTPDDLAHLIEVAPRRGETWESAMSLGVLDALRASR
jgi:2-phospho-L-lactate guanylyltransferase (CobY/MobA/RfbA family)